MRERLRDKERLVHILTAIDNLVDGSKNDLPLLRPQIERYIEEESAKQ